MGWTKGKRRNDPGPEWPKTRRRLGEALRRTTRRVRGRTRCRSRAALADHLGGVSVTTVRAWMSGEALPTKEVAAKIAAWLAEVSTSG